jgi:hypothetical protein
MFSIQLIIGVLFNILTSLSPFIPKKSNIPKEHLFKRYYLVWFIVLLHYLSFLFIIFSPGNIFINIGICILLHVLINPLIRIKSKLPLV